MKLLDALLLESEAKIQLINTRQGDKIWGKIKNLPDNNFMSSEEFIRYVDSINDKYTQWVVNQFLSDKITYMKIKQELGQTIKNFDKYKRVLEKKDINRYETFDELVDAVWLAHTSGNDPVSKREQEKLEKDKFFSTGDAEVFYQDSNIKIVIPHTEESSCYFGKGTKWCTAGEQDNRFDDYNRRSPLYIIMPKGEQKYQLWFGSSSVQFMDSKDVQITQEEIDRLDSKYGIKKIFEKQVKEHAYYPMLENPTIYDFVVYYEKIIDHYETYRTYFDTISDLSKLKFRNKQYTDVGLYDEFMQRYNSSSDVKHLIKFLSLISKSITSKLLNVLVEDDVIDKSNLAKDIIQFYDPVNSGNANTFIDEYLYTNDLSGTIRYYHSYLFTDENLNIEFLNNPKLFTEMITDSRGTINTRFMSSIIRKLTPETIDKIISVMNIDQVFGTEIIRTASKKVKKEWLEKYPVQTLKTLIGLREFTPTEKSEIMDSAFEKAINLIQILTITNNYPEDISVENIDTIFQNKWVAERDYLNIIDHFKIIGYKLNDREGMMNRVLSNIPVKFLSDNYKKIENIFSDTRLGSNYMKHIDYRIKNS